MSDLCYSRGVLGVTSCVLDENMLDNGYYATQTLNFKFDFFDLVTSDGLDLCDTRLSKGLKSVPRSIPVTIHAVSSAFFI